MKCRGVRLCLWVVSSLVLISTAHADSNINTAEVDRLFDETMQAFALPGMALGVLENSQLTHWRVAGVAHHGEKAQITPDTLFKIGSNTKAMTAALLARLVDAGKLQWSDPVRRYLPHFTLHDPWVTQEMQVRDLLIHNSGLGLGAGDLMLWPEPNHFSRDDVLAGLAHLKPISSFRSSYAYDNLLYIVAGEVAAAVGGADFETLLKREVFTPLKMTRCQVGAFSRESVGNLASPHQHHHGEWHAVRPDVDTVPVITSAAAGGVWCSLNDMLTWMKNWTNPSLTPGWLSETQRQTLVRPQMPMPLSARQARWEGSNFLAYGYGFRLSDVNGQFRISHTGTLSGMYSAMAMFPATGTSYVFLINGEADSARTVLDAALSRLVTHPNSQPSISVLASELAQERVASRAAEIRAKTAERQLVSVEEISSFFGVYRDPWFGEISLCPVDNGVQWRSHKSPRMQGTVMRSDERLLVAWEHPAISNADAWLTLSSSGSGSRTIAMSAVDPETDFSYDFHDLSPHWIRRCD